VSLFDGASTSPFDQPDDIYTRLQVSGKDVGALYPMRPSSGSWGCRPTGSHVTVARADDREGEGAGGNSRWSPSTS
jgi:hypothetical protein